MMSASSIGAGKGGGYARYLEGKTVAPERGDHYLTPGGELAEAPGSWLSAPETLARLGVDPGGPVDGGDFRARRGGQRGPAAPRRLTRRRRAATRGELCGSPLPGRSLGEFWESLRFSACCTPEPAA